MNPKTIDPSPHLRRRAAPLFAIVALAGCARTDIIIAPHASPYDSSSGVVLNRRLGGANVAVGVIAVNDGHEDATWEIRDGGKSLWGCSGTKDGKSSCQEASYGAGDPLKDAITFLAPPIVVDEALGIVDEGGTSVEGAPDSTSPGASLDERKIRPLAVPDHGVWATGKVRFLETGLFHCILDGGDPVCTRVATGALPFAAHSRHLIVQGGQTQDILWTSAFSLPSRCYRAGKRSGCQTVTFINP